jgi:hypothetical protein
MCGEEHAGRSICMERRPVSRVRNTGRLLDDLVVVGSALEALGYSAGQTASFTMSIQRPAEAGS